MDHTNISLNLSVEQTPKKIQKKNVSEFVVNNVDYITIPHLNQNTLKTAYKSASQLSDVYGVDPSRVIPHIAARSIIGGNPSKPQGPYSDAESVRRRVTELHNFRLHCGVYPDTESASGVYLYKYFRFESGFTQLSLSPRKLDMFKINTRIGIPSQADFDGLYRYMKLCGVGPSIRYPLRNIFGFARYMTPNGFNTTKLVKAIQPHTTFHVYDFGRIENTVEDLLDLDV